MDFTPFKTAKKRAVSMGKHHSFDPEFNRHPLAPTLANYIFAIDVELEGKDRDYLYILLDWHGMASRVNAYCDEHKVSGDKAAEYWLENYLWIHSSLNKTVVNIDSLCGYESNSF
jgi:hypothetical protein